MFHHDPQHTGCSAYNGPIQASLKWKYATEGLVLSSPAIGADGTIYVGSGDDNLYAFNPDGSLKWQYLTGGAVNSSPAIGTDGTIYVGSDDANLYALTDNGASCTLKWQYASHGAIESAPTIGMDGTIYFGSEDDKKSMPSPIPALPAR